MDLGKKLENTFTWWGTLLVLWLIQRQKVYFHLFLNGVNHDFSYEGIPFDKLFIPFILLEFKGDFVGINIMNYKRLITTLFDESRNLKRDYGSL